MGFNNFTIFDEEMSREVGQYYHYTKKSVEGMV